MNDYLLSLNDAPDDREIAPDGETLERAPKAESLRSRILDIIRSEAVLSESPQIALFAGQVSQKIKELT